MMKRLTFLGIILSAAVWCPAASHDVQIIGFSFSPSTLPVNVTDSVRWIQRDAPPTVHTSTSGQSPTANGLWASGPLVGVGASFTFTFNNPGTFPYFCEPHAFTMLGSVTVSGGNTAPHGFDYQSDERGKFRGADQPSSLPLPPRIRAAPLHKWSSSNGSTSIGVDTSNPYSVSTNFGLGNHVLTAVATDNLSTHEHFRRR
jgi:plastocyanin